MLNQSKILGIFLVISNLLLASLFGYCYSELKPFSKINNLLKKPVEITTFETLNRRVRRRIFIWNLIPFIGIEILVESLTLKTTNFQYFIISALVFLLVAKIFLYMWVFPDFFKKFGTIEIIKLNVFISFCYMVIELIRAFSKTINLKKSSQKSSD